MANPGGRGHADEEIDLLATEFSELARAMQAELSVPATLDTICRLILAVVPHAEHAAITVVKSEAFRTIASTSALPPRIDLLQYRTGQGPCVDAIREREVFRTGDLGEELRWPDFAPRAVRAGVRSMLSMRLFLQEETLGALNLYAGVRDAFTEHDQALGAAFAAHAAVAMQAARDHEQLHNLRTALDNSRRIGAALGILMCRHNISETQAFKLMVEASQHTNRKLRQLADEVSTPANCPADAERPGRARRGK